MALKRKVENLDDVAEAFRGLYTEKTEGDKKWYVLSDEAFPEGMVDKTKLDEFRNNNIELQKQVKELTDKFGNIDLEKYDELRKKEKEIHDKKLLDQGKVDELIAHRTEEMKKKFTNEIQERDSKIGTLESQLGDLQINQVVMAAATKKKALTGAIPDIIMRAKQIFILEDGKVTPKKDGETWIGDDGVTPISITEWVDRLSVEASHLFQGSTGSGASNSSGGGASSKDNPYRKETRNLTKQGLLEKENPTLAARLRKEAEDG